MATSIDVAYVRKFGDDISSLAQQKGSKIMPHVSVDRDNVVMKYYERLGAGSATERLTRHAPTPPIANLAHSRRAAIARTFNISERVDAPDLARMMLDPTSRYVQHMAWALGRTMDDILLQALYGSANVADNALALTTAAFDTANTVDEDWGDTGAGTSSNSDLNVGKLRKAIRLLREGNVDLDNEKPIALVDAGMIDSLLGITQVTSADYNSVKALTNGDVSSFMGITFVPCQALANSTHLTSEGFARCMVFVPSALGVYTPSDLRVEQGKDPGESFDNIVFAEMALGAVRIEEAKVVQIECYRS